MDQGEVGYSESSDPMVSSTITKLYPSSPTRVSWARKKMTIMRIFTTTLTSAKGSFNRCSRTTIEGSKAAMSKKRNLHRHH